MDATQIPYNLTDTQKAHLRRAMGYPAYGNGNDGAQSWRFFQVYGLMEYRLANMSQAEGAIVVDTYLANFIQAEQDIPAALQNLAFDQIAVLTRNKTQAAETVATMAFWGQRMCDFFGIPPGQGLASVSSGAKWRVV